jgi:cytochrome c biogenesis protein
MAGSEERISAGASFGARLTRFLGSMNLAITLLVALGIASVIGTVLQQNQGYASYILKFGPFWHEVFLTLGLYDVYVSAWFVFILVFLVLSTSVCVLRNAPHMLRDMRNFRLNVQDKSLRAFHHVEERSVRESPDDTAMLAGAMLGGAGYRLRSKSRDGYTLLVGMRGGLNRLGYVFAHLGIIVILVGGTLDSMIPLRVGQMLGSVVAETRDIPASQVPEESRLPTSNPSFRGNVNIPEGLDANVVFVGMDDGYLVQNLPFTIQVKDFRVEHYDTGQPKSFESDLTLTDNKSGESIEQTIAVNHPLVYENFAIYQASFADGGSKLDLHMWSLQPDKDSSFVFSGEVFKTYPIESQAMGTMKLELDDFRLFNIEPVLNDAGIEEQRNVGPNFSFKLRDGQGQAREYMNYMNPIRQQGRWFYVSGVRDSQADPFRYLNIPQDPEGGLTRFMGFISMLRDEAKVKQIAAETTRNATQAAGIESDEIRGQIEMTMIRLLGLFAEGGYDAVLNDIGDNMPEDKRQAAADALVKVLHTGTRAVYLNLLKEMDVTEPTDTDWQFYEDAMSTTSVLPFYGAPYYVQMGGFEHIQATGLQITRSPGKDVVYLGSTLLIIGVFMMFYIAHRRFWVRIEDDGTGSRILFAGSSNRNPMDFDTEYEQLKNRLFGSLNKSA